MSSSEDETENWKDLTTQIRDELIPHSRAEEALFYHSIRKAENGKTAMIHSDQEHAMAEADLRALQAIDTNWKTLAKKLRSDLLHPVKNEEDKIFVAAEQIFSEAEAKNRGEAFELLKPKVKEQSFTETSIDFALNLLPEKMRTKIDSILLKTKGKIA